MSTRAIIGIQNANGTITAGWQWNDGMSKLPLLRKYFGTLEKVQELVKNGVWNNLVPTEEKNLLDHFAEWTKCPNSDYYLVSVKDCHLLKEKPCDNALFCFGSDECITVNDDGSMTFDSFETANGQDINYLYLFYPDTNEWKVFK